MGTFKKIKQKLSKAFNDEYHDAFWYFREYRKSECLGNNADEYCNNRAAREAVLSIIDDCCKKYLVSCIKYKVYETNCKILRQYVDGDIEQLIIWLFILENKVTAELMLETDLECEIL